MLLTVSLWTALLGAPASAIAPPAMASLLFPALLQEPVGDELEVPEGVTEEDGMGTFHWVLWLLDRLEEHHKADEYKPHLNQKDWKP